MNECEQIENDIIELKKARFNDDKIKVYNRIASGLTRYLKQTGIKQFQKSLILSFFPSGFFPISTQRKHVKQIIDTLKQNGIIDDDKINKIAQQRRNYILKSKDFDSYTALMNNNGFKEIIYYKFYCDSDGIPRRRKIATSNINGIPRDKNGDVVEDYDLSVLKQTIPRRKQGVYSYGNKSIAIEKRAYSVEGYKVLI